VEEFTVYYWTITTDYELFAFRGNEPEEKVKREEKEK
jgi:hypothetical protein